MYKNDTTRNGKRPKKAFWDVVNYSFNDIENVKVKPIKYGFFIETGINLFVAGAGSGKTLLQYVLAVYYLKQGKKVIYVDMDNPVDLPKSRKLDVVIKEQDLVSNFTYLNTNHYQRWVEERRKGTYTDFLKEVLENVEDGSIVFIDSLQNFVDTNDIKEVASFMVFIRRYSNKKNITFSIIHHVSKITGKSKGQTQVEDMADSVYYIKPQKRNSLVESWGLFVGKQRYTTKEELTIKLLDSYEFEISDVAFPDETTKAVLRFIVSYLRKSNKPLKQGEIKEAVKEKFPNVGNNRIFNILKEYTDKGLFHKEVGFRNAKHYSVNEESNYIKSLFNTELSKTKKKTLAFLKGIFSFSKPIEIQKAGKQVKYKDPVSLKKDVYSLSDEEAEDVWCQFKEFLNTDLEQRTRLEVLDLAEEVPEDDNPVFETLDKYGVMNRKDLEEHIGNIPIDVLKDFKGILEKTPTGV